MFSLEQPSIELFGLVIHTPVTAITDVFVAIICLVAYFKLNKIPSRGKVHQFFKYYFLTMSMATFLGGVLGHGLMHYLPFGWKIPAWITSMFSVAFLERAVIEHSRKYVSKRLGLFFAWLNIIELVTFMVLALVFLEFRFVLVHAGYGMAIVVTGFTAYIYFKEKSLGSKQILFAVLLCAIGAAFFLAEFGFSIWFNHYDISHVFMMAASVYYYKGSRALIHNPLEE